MKDQEKQVWKWGPCFALGLIIFVGIVVIKPAKICGLRKEKKKKNHVNYFLVQNKFSLKSQIILTFAHAELCLIYTRDFK